MIVICIYYISKFSLQHMCAEVGDKKKLVFKISRNRCPDKFYIQLLPTIWYTFTNSVRATSPTSDGVVSVHTFFQNHQGYYFTVTLYLAFLLSCIDQLIFILILFWNVKRSPQSSCSKWCDCWMWILWSSPPISQWRLWFKYFASPR
jgi:hypothetical protein